MKTATITEVKNGLSALIDRVRAGESVLILDRGIPVARLEPAKTTANPDGRIRRLERSGVLHVGQSALPLALLEQPGPALAKGSSAVELVLEERSAGR